MNSLIKLTIITLLISLTSESFAQTFGIKAGLNLSNMVIKDSEVYFPYDYPDDKPEMNPGFHLGVTSGFPVSDLFTLETGLLFNTMGYRRITEEPFGSTILVTKENHNLLYLDIPLTVKIPFSVTGYNFYGSFGSYAGMGITGNIKTIATFGDLVETEKRNLRWGSEAGVDELRRLDYGLTFGVGMKLSDFQIGLSYILGLANISPESASRSKLSNRVLGISVGYKFGGFKKSVDSKVKSENQAKSKSIGRKAAAIEAERLRMEKIRTDSIVAAKTEQERIRNAKARTDSIEAARVMAVKLESERKAKIKTDSISEAQKVAVLKPTKDIVVFRVQFASNTTKKGSYNMIIGGKNYRTWEYLYKGAYRTTVGEFKTLKAAMEFQKLVTKSGYPQNFVVAFKNNVRTTDPSLFK